MKPQRKRIARWYSEVYGLLCGTGTHKNIFHFQFLATYQLYPELRRVLGQREGSVLDFGCGQKPYQSWFKSTPEYIGVDLETVGGVDVHVVGGKLPKLNTQFDYVLATQVFEHTEHLGYIPELFEILKPNGEIIVTVQFLYHITDEYDFRRFTLAGTERVLLDAGFETISKRPLGGVGSTTTLLFLGFCDEVLSQNKITKVIKFVILPLSIPITGIVNVLSLLIDSIDRTNRFYNNQLIIAKKP